MGIGHLILLILLLTSQLTSLAFEGTSVLLVSSKYRPEPVHERCCCLGADESYTILRCRDTSWSGVITGLGCSAVGMGAEQQFHSGAAGVIALYFEPVWYCLEINSL